MRGGEKISLLAPDSGAMLTTLLFLLVSINAISCVLIRAPSVFRPEEIDVHKYAAALATTEPFRRQCQRDLARQVNPLRRLLGVLTGKDILAQAHEIRQNSKEIDETLTKFENCVDNTLKSYKLTVQSFNALSTQLTKQQGVRKKVLLQAYFYKIAADLESNLRSTLPLLPSLSSCQPKVKVADKEVSPPQGERLRQSSTLKRFALTLREIENCRLRLREKIKRDLNLRVLPPRIADPDYLPAMSPVIQKACTDFPSLAQRIISMYGLFVEDFNTLQERMERSAWFRHRVQREIKQIERDSQRNALQAKAPEKKTK